MAPLVLACFFLAFGDAVALLSLLLKALEKKPMLNSVCYIWMLVDMLADTLDMVLGVERVGLGVSRGDFLEYALEGSEGG